MNSINDNGQFVGQALSSDLSYTAFLSTPGKGFVTLPTLGGRAGLWASATAINDTGQVVGYSDPKSSTGAPHADNPHAFLYSGGQMIDLGVLPGTTRSFADGINNVGDVVGISTVEEDPDTPYVLDAFLYENGAMIDLNSLLPATPAGICRRPPASTTKVNHRLRII